MSTSRATSALAALLVLGGLGAACAAESLDQRLFRQINGRWQRPWLDGPMSALSTAGDAKAGLALCAGVGLFCGQRGHDAAKLALAADAGAALVTFGLKCAVGRARPDGIADRTNSSFPSGHATGAFALATVFGHEYPKLAVPCYALASGIALSRVYRGRHYPSDVLAGAAVGYASARLVLHFRERVLGIDASRLRRKDRRQPDIEQTPRIQSPDTTAVPLTPDAQPEPGQ